MRLVCDFLLPSGMNRIVRRVRTFLFCLIVGTMFSPFAHAEVQSDASVEQSGAQNRVTLRLVRRLGDDVFAVRERASRDLFKIGTVALPALRKALGDPELEIRLRSRRLIDAIERQDLSRRVTAFRKDSNAAQGHGLPGWSRFRVAVGSSAAARKLFADMQHAEPKLFRLSQGEQKRWQNEFEKRCRSLLGRAFLRQSRKISAASVVAVLFLSSDPHLKTPAQLDNVLYRLVSHRDFRKLLTGSETSAAARKVLGLWIASSAGGNPYQKVTLAMQYNLKAGLVPGLELVRAGGGGPQVQYGLLVVGRFGNRSHISLVEKQLDNKTLTLRSRRKGRDTYRCEVRDVALAVLIHLTGQDAGPYRFTRLRKSTRYLFSPGSAGFTSEAVRLSARNRWSLWRSAHPQPTTDSTAK